MALTAIIELGVAEAYTLLVERFGVLDLPPLEAIENEDWGRDLVLSRFEPIPVADLAAAGLGWDLDADPPVSPAEIKGPATP